MVIDFMWKNISGFEDYQVHSSGLVRRKDRMIRSTSSKGNVYYRIQKGAMMVPSCNGLGYLQINLTNGNVSTRKYLHVIVAEAFLPEKPDINYEVDHIDEDKSNCNVTNLQWFTRKQNMDKMFLSNPHVISNLKNQK